MKSDKPKQTFFLLQRRRQPSDSRAKNGTPLLQYLTIDLNKRETSPNFTEQFYSPRSQPSHHWSRRRKKHRFNNFSQFYCHPQTHTFTLTRFQNCPPEPKSNPPPPEKLTLTKETPNLIQYDLYQISAVPDQTHPFSHDQICKAD